MIKCTCGVKDCPISLNIQGDELWFVSKSGETTLMYLDANALVQLSQEAKLALVSIANEQ